jgi:putative ABC transport system permease protein
MGTVWHDIRYGVRMLGRSPGFTAVAVLTLALGIGGTTAILGVLNAHVLNPVPLRNERRLVEFKELSRARQSRVWLSPPLYQDLAQRRDLFEQVVSFQHDTLQIAGQDFLEYVHGSRVTHNFLDLFEVRPILGRWLTKEEQDAAVEDVLVISYAAWQARFGGDPNVLGRTLKTKDATYTIIGVMPAHFQFPARITEYWRPLHFHGAELSDSSSRLKRTYYGFALLASGVSPAQVQAFLDAWGARLARDFPRECQDFIVESRPLRDYFVAPEIRRTLWSVALALGFVLVIACANLANLQLGRMEVRSREMSLRLALGACRCRVVRQLLTESLLLSLAGGVCALLAHVLWEGMKPTAVGIVIGLVGAFVLTRLLQSQLFGIGPTDPVTFVLVPLLLTAAALLSCWFPARRAARTDPMVALRYE